MNYKFKTKPYEHQLKALDISRAKSYFAYFMEMGTGKSKVLLDNIAMLYDQGKIDGALIIAPKGVVGTWYDQEIPTHFPEHIEKTSVLWQANITKGQSKKLGNLSFNKRKAVSRKLLFSASSSIGYPRYHNLPSFPSIKVILLSQLEVAINPGS